MSNSIISWMISFFTTIVAAFIGFYLAFSKFKKEKLWQEKYNAYQEILGSINNMKHWASETYCQCLCLPTIGNSNDNELYQGYVEARNCISKYISIGKLIINDNVSKKLDELNQLLWDEEFNFGEEGYDDSNYHEVLSGHASRIENIIDDRIKDIIDLAKKDLRV